MSEDKKDNLDGGKIFDEMRDFIKAGGPTIVIDSVPEVHPNGRGLSKPERILLGEEEISTFEILDPEKARTILEQHRGPAKKHSNKSTREIFEELRTFVQEKGIIAILDSIPPEYREESPSLEISAKHIGGEDMIEKQSNLFPSIDGLEKHFADMPEFAEDIKKVLEKTRFNALLPHHISSLTKLYNDLYNPPTLKMVIAGMKISDEDRKKGYSWPIVLEDIDCLGTYPFVKDPVEVKIAEDFDKKRE